LRGKDTAFYCINLSPTMATRYYKRQPSLLVSLHMSAAVDTIDHSTLLNRLSVGFGVSGSVLTWLKSYLTDRYQCVRVGQASSSPTLCHTGVPQGSVLGPILSSCYISPISFTANTFGIGIQQYADGTQLYISLTPTDMHVRQSLLVNCLSALHSWFCHNGLALNSTKSESFLTGTRQRLHTLPPTASPIIAGTPIPFWDTIKMPGVTMDQNLTLNKHVSLLSRSIHFYTRALRHIRPALTESMAASLGTSLVHSRLDYGNSIMYGMSASNMHKLQSAQNSLTHVVLPSLHYLSGSQWLSYLHWLPIHYRIQFKITTLTYKTLATCQTSYLYNLLQVYHPSRALRSSTQQLLDVPYMSTDFGRCTFSYSSPATRNSIPISIKNCSSLYSFKRHLKSCFIAQLINN